MKKKSNIFLKILFVLIIIFMGLYIANISGYYEARIHDKVIVTEKGIREFEEKIEKNEEIDIESFLNNERVDYSSRMSNLGDNMTSSLEGVIEKGAKIIRDILKSLF